jgi:DNA helicase-2/ATP-dependent DNA helicase PcrA
MSDLVDDDQFDAAADETIWTCLNLESPKSFFLYAGAGSGKTRSLVEAVRKVCHAQGRWLSLRGQRVGVITFTNAARDEIMQRLEFDPRVDVSTIHSFAWSLINGYHHDIRAWLRINLGTEIAELGRLQARGRPNTKAFVDRARSIEGKQRRRDALHEIQKFIYSPTGDNRTRDSLNHGEVIAMTAEFLITKRALQRLLVSRYPLLLIDESQDTNHRLMDALLHVQMGNELSFCLGLFGDTMQRIYADGKVGLAEAIPDSWARPEKRMNHRCPSRVIRLINKVRLDDDRQQQRGRADNTEGVVRLFVLRDTTADKFGAEVSIAKAMAAATHDDGWIAGSNAVKTLTLEHHMAAQRLGFKDFFEALYPVERFRTGLLDGSLSGIALFTRDVLPLLQAMAAGDRFRTAAVVRQNSPLLDRGSLEAAGENQVESLKRAKEASDLLNGLFSGGEQPSLMTVLRNVAGSGLFPIPDSLTPFIAPTLPDAKDLDDEDDVKSETVAWRLALETPFDQIERYDQYIRGLSQFATHQGVKGLEFPRVIVIISDEEARGFMFSYEKLFGSKDKSKTDLENDAAGKETTIERTRRLFYVTCSRAEQSLAVVYYSSRPSMVADLAIQRGWFDKSEVELIA